MTFTKAKRILPRWLVVLSIAVLGIGTAAGDSGCAAGDPPESQDSGSDPLADGSGPQAFPEPVKSGSQCSQDLRSVLDDQGKVVMTCPDEQGCANGQCVPACDAARVNGSSLGCDFVVATPESVRDILSPCFAVIVTNAWPRPAHIAVTHDGVDYDVTTFARIMEESVYAFEWERVPSSGLPEGKVAVLFLSDDPESKFFGDPLTCAVDPAIRRDGGTSLAGGIWAKPMTGVGHAWHIVTDAPVIAYDMLPYGHAKSYFPSAQLLMPTTAWGKNYVAAVPPPGNLRLARTGQLIASEDDTTIKILPRVDLPSNDTVAGAPKNAVTTYKLDAFRYLQWASGADLSGTIIEADKPVSFVGGHECLLLGSASSPDGGACDSAHQLVPPISALGSEYAVAPYKDRAHVRSQGAKESIPYRIMGVVEGTTLTYDPPIPGAPPALALGQAVDFEGTGPFVVKSQDGDHPFYATQLMAGDQQAEGDPEWINILPPGQFISKYVFFTDVSYPTTYLVFIRVKAEGTFHDVELDCLGKVTGWKPVGTAGEYEMAYVDLVVDGKPNGACRNGAHVASSAGRFGLIVWGLERASSYAYPAGGNARRLNSVVVPADVK